jgi:hypothetical protein
MKKKTDEYTTTRIWVKSHRRLKIIAALTNRSVVEVIDQLSQQELERLQKGGNHAQVIQIPPLSQ